MPPTVPGGLPEINESTAQIVNTLLRYGPLSRVELARRLSLTPSALTKLTKPMLEVGLLSQVEGIGSKVSGRPRQPLSINAAWASFVGIKLTADTTFAVVTDLAGTVLASHEAPLKGTGPDDVIDAMVHQINYLCPTDTPAEVGVSLAGLVIRSRGHVVSSPFLEWADVDLAGRLEKLLAVPVVVENDVRALTTAQHWFDPTLTSLALVTFGAGLGCGLVLNDRVIEGSGGAAGLIGHLRVDDGAAECRWGHRGCASAYATTESILHAVSQGSPPAPTALADVGARARAGDPVAQRALGDAGYAIGCVMGTVCNVTGPAAVILSGEGAELFDILSDSLEAGMADTIHPALPPIPLTVRPMEFAEVARGAAVVAIQRHLQLRSGLAA